MMHPALPPFNPEARCPKCGHDAVNVVYVKAHAGGSTPGCGATIDDFKYREHMDRACQRCHYEWGEAVLEPASAARGAGPDGGE